MANSGYEKGLPPPGSLLFAYGTLKQRGRYHYFLERCRARFVSPGRLKVAYPLFLAQYPCLIDQPGNGFQVCGEIYEIKNSADWESIDNLEGYPDEYTRRIEAVETDSGMLRSWTYFFRHPGQLDPTLEPVSEFRPGRSDHAMRDDSLGNA